MKHSGIHIHINAGITLMIMAFFLALPLMWGYFFTDHHGRLVFENRPLAQRPDVSEIIDPKSYFTDLEEYLEDRIGFAVSVNTIYRKLAYYLFSESTVKNISVTKEKFVFLTSHFPDLKNQGIENLCRPHSSDQLRKQSLSNLIKISQKIKSYGHRVIFTSAVSKPVLYPEALPWDIHPATRKKCLEFYGEDNLISQLERGAKDHGLIFHYPFKAFTSVKSQPHFYPRENFHWSGQSAHLFARTLFTRLGLKMDDCFNTGKRLVTAEADLKALGFTRNIKIWDFPYSDFKIKGGFMDKGLDPVRPYYERLIDGSFYTTRNPLMNKHAILFSDSFGRNTAKHLATGYKSLTHININYLKKEEKTLFFETMLTSRPGMDVIVLFFDASIISGHALQNMANSIDNLRPGPL